MRELKFRAWVEIGDSSEVNGMIENVAVYVGGHDGNVGCTIDDFNEGIKKSGYHFDGDNSLISSEIIIEADEFNVYCHEGDWVFFEGELMQCTGLKDKNGKEIYEGDVLYNASSFGCITGWGEGEMDNHPNTKLIVWDENEAKFKLDFVEEKYRGRGVSGFTLCASNCNEQFEVIGNIYQNPELL